MERDDSFLSSHVLFSMVLGVVLTLLGLVVMTSQTTLIAIMTGLALVWSGIAALRTSFAFAVWTGYLRLFNILKGVVCLALGVWGILHAQKSFSLVMYLMGAQMVVGGVLSIVTFFLLRRDNDIPAGGVLSDGVCSLVVALVLFLAPQMVGKTLLLVAGGAMVFVGVCLFLWGVKIRKIDREVPVNVEVLEEKNLEK